MLNDILNWYWTIYLMVVIYWLMWFFLDHTTSKMNLFSWVIILTAPLLWPIVLPICNWELSRKRLKQTWL